MSEFIKCTNCTHPIYDNDEIVDTFFCTDLNDDCTCDCHDEDGIDHE